MNKFGYQLPHTNFFVGEPLQNWWTNSPGRFAFSRGSKGFIAASKDGYMNENVNTGLPDGKYCNIISGDVVDGACTS